MIKKALIHNKEIEIVDSYKYLGTTFDAKLKWEENTQLITRKCQQRIYFLRKLASFSVDKTILNLFYSSFIESILCFSFICWFYNLNIKQRNNVNRIVTLCSKIIGVSLRDVSTFCQKQIIRKAHSIISNPNHALSSSFNHLPSRRRFSVLVCRTNRRKFSFVPTAVRLMNESL